MKNPVAHSPLITGTQVNYCLVCPRKLWLFSTVTLDGQFSKTYSDLG